jgi:hypothetical protein
VHKLLVKDHIQSAESKKSFAVGSGYSKTKSGYLVRRHPDYTSFQSYNEEKISLRPTISKAGAPTCKPQAYGEHVLVTLRIIRKTPRTSSTLSISSGSPMSFTAASTLSSSSTNYRRDMQFGFRISNLTKTTQESSPCPHILVFL